MKKKTLYVIFYICSPLILFSGTEVQKIYQKDIGLHLQTKYIILKGDKRFIFKYNYNRYNYK